MHFTSSCSLLQLLSRTNRNSECVKYAKPPPWPHKDSTILPWQDFARLLLHTFPMLCTLETHHKTLFLHNTRDIQVLEQAKPGKKKIACFILNVHNFGREALPGVAVDNECRQGSHDEAGWTDPELEGAGDLARNIFEGLKYWKKVFKTRQTIWKGIFLRG